MRDSVAIVFFCLVLPILRVQLLEENAACGFAVAVSCLVEANGINLVVEVFLVLGFPS